MKNASTFINKIKSFFKNESQVETEKFVIAQKSCPHCASRGMFIFNSLANTKISNGKSNENKR